MEAIIEKLLLIEDEQILNTPLEELDLPTRVYRSLWRGRVWTIRDLAQIWSDILPLRNIGTWARGKILGALEAWSLSIPNFTDLAEAEKRRDVPGCHPDLGTPIKALHLSQRTYRALKRNKIHTIADILQGWDKIPSIRNVGQGTMDEIQKALEAFHPSHECPPTKNDFADPATADAVGYEPMSEVLTKTHVISDSGVLVSVDLLQAGEPRRSREERWRNVAPKPQDYAPKNTFQAIGEGQNKISSPIERRKKTLDGSVPIATEWLEMSLYLLERTRTSRQVRTINCPICMALTLSIKLKQHLVENHPQAYQEVRKVAKGSSGRQFQKHLVDRYTQAFQELKKAPSDSPGRHTEKSVGIAHTDPLQERSMVKCPLCEHVSQYDVLHAHIQDSHPAIDSRLMMIRFNRVHRSGDYKNLSRYQDELNELIREYKWLTQGQEEPRDGSK